MSDDIVVTRVKEMRAKLGITQQQLAFDTGLSVAGIQSIEGGRAKPNIETLAKLAVRFGCTTDYLLGNSDSSVESLIRIYKDLPEDKKKVIDELIKDLIKPKDPQ